MPTYDYKCTQCGLDFELYLRHSGDPTGGCINCGGEIKQVFRTTANVLRRKTPYDYIGKEKTPSVTVPVSRKYKGK